MRGNTKMPKKEITIEDLKEGAMRSYEILPKFKGFGEPTNNYKVGDKVRVGNLSNCIVDEIVEKDGIKLYGILHDERRNNFNNRIVSFNGKEIPVEKEYSYYPWYNVYPYELGKSNSNFTQENDIDIRFSNTTIESLMNKYYLHGVNMDPDYQRGYVWDDKDRESLLDSIFSHIEIGKFAFIHKGYSKDIQYEILDGKQRLSTLLGYYENQFPYKGVYFNDLSFKDRHTFLNTPVTVGETSEMSREQIYKYFYKLNKSGKVMDKSHLEKIKELAESEKELIEFVSDDKDDEIEI